MDTMDQKLVALSKHGKVWLHTTENGKWMASLDVRCIDAGSSMSIRLPEYCDEPTMAVDKLTEQVKTNSYIAHQIAMRKVLDDTKPN